MLRLLTFLWDGCWHKWREDHRVPFDFYRDGRKTPDTGERVFTVCERCGAQRKWDLA